MDHLLVPHEASTSSATVWVGARRRPQAGLRLLVGNDRQVVLTDGWSAWQAGGRAVFWSRRVSVGGLAPGRRYPLRLVDDGTELAHGTAVTLPDELPSQAETPFVCLLGSCFAHFSDQAGAAGAAFAALPHGARPHVKFLSGDQVYLDAPFPRFLYNVYDEEQLRSELLVNYLDAWMQGADGWGFSEVLRSGATYFSSDDHEIWNNAPSATPVVRATWWPFGDRGAGWLQLAQILYDTFQTPRRRDCFKIGRLSFMVLDTRLERTTDRRQFSSPASLAALDRWVQALEGPGVLVVGQPILIEPTGVRGHFTDWGLADFAQYGELVRSLSRSAHDLLVLTGDVHYGRVAGCQLPSGASLIEIIASPFALVDRRVGGKWHPPPGRFPASAVPGVAPRPTWLEEGHQLAEHQFATLEFTARGAGAHVAVRSWEIPSVGHSPTSKVVLDRTLN